MGNYFDIEIGVCRTVMRIFGIWPKGRDFTCYVRFVILIGMVLGFCNIPQTVKMFEVSGNFDEMLDVITTCNLTNMNSLLRISIFWFKNRAVVQLLDAMDADWKARKTDIELKIMLKNAKISRLITIVVLGTFELAVFSLLLVNALDRSRDSKHFRQGKINASEWVRPMYFASTFPYDTQMSPYYEITWVFQFLTTFFTATSYAAMDGLLSSLVFHLCAQMKILRGQLAKLLDEATSKKDKSKRIDFSRIVKRHESLLRFAETIESVHNLQFLWQLLLSILIFCLTGYQIVRIITADAIILFELIFAIYYYLCFATSLFVYCLIATRLSTESTKMRETAYNSQFYELSPSDARLLILIMVRTRQPFELTAGKFVAMSFELYCSVVKTSGVYLSILMAMKNRLATD